MRLLPALILGVPLLAQMTAPLQDRADRFLKVVNAGYQSLYTVASEATWAASTDVKPENDAAAEWAGRAAAAFNGNPALITEARELLAHRKELKDLTVRQLERVLLNAAEGPMTNPRLVADRVAAETAQASRMNGYVWKLDGQPLSANRIDELLAKSGDLAERRRVWEVSKESGPVLKDGLLRLRDLRNSCARELGYPDYFALQVAKYGLSTDEMMAFNRKFLEAAMAFRIEMEMSKEKILELYMNRIYFGSGLSMGSRLRVRPISENLPPIWIFRREPCLQD